MRTRNNGAQNNGIYTEEIHAICKETVKKFDPIIKNLNIFIVKNLKMNRRQSPIHRIKIDINESFQNILIN